MRIRECLLRVQISLCRLKLQHTVVMKHLASWQSKCWVHYSGTQLQKPDQHFEVPVIKSADSEKDKFHIDPKKILQIQKHLKRQGIKMTKNKLEEKWLYLKSHGCLDDHVYCYPKILSVPEVELVEQVCRLSELGCEKISVGLLRLARTHTKKLKPKVKAYLQDSFNQSATAEDVIQCNQNELEILVQKIPHIMGSLAYNPRTLKDKVDILYQNGYSIADIKDHPTVLGLSVKRICDRLAQINELEGLQQKPKLSAICHNEFEKHLLRLQGSGHQLKESEKAKHFVKLFDTDEEKLKLTKQMKQTSVILTRQKIATLEKVGFSRREIMFKPKVLQYSNHSIKQAIDFIKAQDGDCRFDLVHLCDVLQLKVSRKHKHVSEHLLKHIASKLDVDISSFTKTQKNLFGNAPLYYVNENMMFLEQKGFSKSDLRSCPLILVQEPGMVQKYFHEVHEMENIKHFRDVNIKFLNVIQYFIEFENKMDHIDDSKIDQIDDS